MKYFLFLGMLVFSLLACNSSNSETKQETKTPPQPEAAAPVQTQQLYPSIPKEIVLNLFDECDFLDVIFNGSFHGVSMSLSQDQQNDIRQTLSFITTSPAQINPSCKAVGRMFFLKKGETLLEADFYLQNDCNYFVFYEGKTKKYGNQMSEQGLNYFLQMIQKAGQVRGQ